MRSYLNQGGLPHAFLISGPTGLGQLDLALLFSKTLLCSQDQTHAVPCCHCGSCIQFDADTHPDCYRALIAEPGKTLSVDAVRACLIWFSQTRHQHGRLPGYQIVIISPAEQLSLSAAQAMLKMLEEPKPGLLFILVTHHPMQLLPTLRSRCQPVVCSPYGFETEKKAFLIEKQSKMTPPNDLGHTLSVETVLHAADQAPCLAYAWLREPDLWKTRTAYLNAMLDVLDSDRDPIATMQTYAHLDSTLVLDWSLSLLLDWLRLYHNLSEARIQNQSCLPRLKRLMSLNLPETALWTCLDRWYDAKSHCLEVPSLNREYTLDHVWIGWALLNTTRESITC